MFNWKKKKETKERGIQAFNEFQRTKPKWLKTKWDSDIVNKYYPYVMESYMVLTIRTFRPLLSDGEVSDEITSGIFVSDLKNKFANLPFEFKQTIIDEMVSLTIDMNKFVISKIEKIKHFDDEWYGAGAKNPRVIAMQIKSMINDTRTAYEVLIYNVLSNKVIDGIKNNLSIDQCKELMKKDFGEFKAAIDSDMKLYYEYFSANSRFDVEQGIIRNATAKENYSWSNYFKKLNKYVLDEIDWERLMPYSFLGVLPPLRDGRSSNFEFNLADVANALTKIDDKWIKDNVFWVDETLTNVDLHSMVSAAAMIVSWWYKLD